MVMKFSRAERKQAKLRLAIESASGGGKTHSSLLIAKGLGGKIALIDTEHGSGSLEVGKTGIPDYDTLELDPPFTPKRYIEAIRAGEAAGYDVIIIDSLSHEWQGEGGTLDMHDKATSASKSGNSYTSWKEVTPEHDKLVNAILQSKCHVIATMRTKQEYAQTEENGKKVVKKLGMAPVQREGMDYEFTVVLDLSQEHVATASKDRTSLFDGQHFTPTADTGKQLLNWLNSGKAVEVIEVKKEPETQHLEPSNPATVETGELAPAPMLTNLNASRKAMGYSDDVMRDILKTRYKVEKATQLTKLQCQELVNMVAQAKRINDAGEWIDA